MALHVRMAAILLGLLAWCLSLFPLVPLAGAQPRADLMPLHTAEAGATANGATVLVLGYEAVTVQNTIAAAWDGTLTYEVTTDNSNWTAVNCRNALGTTVSSTTVAAAGYVVCPVTGAQGFRARVSGRTVGTVTAVAARLSMTHAGVLSAIPPSGTSATQVQGTAADGAAAVGNPVQVGGKDGAGNAQTLSTDATGRLDVNPIAGQAGLAGGTGVDSPLALRTSLATNIPLPAGTNIIGALSANQSVNVAQIAGVVPPISATTGSVIAPFTASTSGADGLSNVQDAAKNPANTGVVFARTWAHLFNGTTWDRLRSIITGTDSTGTGIQAVGLVAQLDDISPSTVTENQFGNVRLSPRRALYVETLPTNPDPCHSSVAKSSVAIAVTSDAQIIAASGSTVIYVCGFSVSLTGTAPTMRFIYGTGAVCATGLTALTGVYAPLTGSMLVYGSGSAIFATPASQALCLDTGGTTPSVQGVLTYVQQ